ncbi:MAG: sulfotransferase [Bacteroidota bacterium]
MLVNILFSRVCLLLDEIFFPGYRKTTIDKAAFIIGIPRSGTTFLFHSLARDIDNFHSFKLWELVFAPSILQKKILGILYLLDKKLGGHMARKIKKLDRIIFGDFRGIHNIGINKPEEDEALFIYNFSSAYFAYIFPEVKFMDKYLNFDKQLPENVKKRNVKFYYRLVQRHKYCFDPENNKYFLSKNPAFVSKISTVANQFSRAKFIIPNRSPLETIPSTISLNAHIYKAFCHMPTEYPLVEKTRDQVIKWHDHLKVVIENDLSNRALIIDFKNIVNKPGETILNCYNYLNITADRKAIDEKVKQSGAEKYVSPHHYPKTLGLEDDSIKEKIIDLTHDYSLNK